MPTTPNNNDEKLKWSYSERWGFTILGAGVVLLFILIGYWLCGGKPNPESHHIQVYVAVDTLTSDVVDLYTRAQVDSIIDCLQNHEALLDKKYQYILEQREEEDRFKTYLAIIVSIILSIAAFFGFKTISELKKQCREESEALSSAIAEKKAIEVAEKIAEEKANTVAAEKAKEKAKKIAEATAKKVAAEKAKSVAKNVAQQRATEISKVKAKEAAELYLKENLDNLVDTSVTQYLESNLQKLVNDKIENLYNGEGRQSIIGELKTVIIENLNEFLTIDPGKAFIDSAIQEAMDLSLGDRVDAIIEKSIYEKLDQLNLTPDNSTDVSEEDADNNEEEEDDSNPGGMF